MTDNLQDDKDLQLLDQRLREWNTQIETYEMPAQHWPKRFVVSLMMGQEGRPSNAFNAKVEGLVGKADGEIHAPYGQIGFAASFPTEDKRMEFLHAFAAAARDELPERNGIRPSHNGWKLGAFGI